MSLVQRGGCDDLAASGITNWVGGADDLAVSGITKGEAGTGAEDSVETETYILSAKMVPFSIKT